VSVDDALADENAIMRANLLSRLIDRFMIFSWVVLYSLILAVFEVLSWAEGFRSRRTHLQEQ
jgi:hypothetical protein